MPQTQRDLASPIDAYLRSLHAKYAGDCEGQVANYIPELAKSSPEWFGICIATRDGNIYEVGDSRQLFTIQSISKALSYGLALEDCGEEHMLSRISVEPSGDAFNAISLVPGSGAPFNPMINAGAIATCGQIVRKDDASRIRRIVSYLSACAGRSLDIDEAVYRSESETGHRNRAIGWMLRNFNIIDAEPTEILETYFQQCSIRVTCRDLALMGATLANYGRNPLTREQAIAPEYVDNILSVMSSCGMYDYSGKWLYSIGLPAKSGVGGGIMAVLPGQLGIGIFSPPLDAQGNSVRGIKVCADLSRELALHLFGVGSAPQSALRLSYDGSQVSSSRRRPGNQQKTLRASGHRIRVMDLQGELIFSSVEPIVRQALKHAPYCQYLVMVFRNVVTIDAVAAKLIEELRHHLADQGVKMVIAHASASLHKPLFAAIDRDSLMASSDSALEFCENRLLHDLLGDASSSRFSVALGDTFLLSGLNADDIAWLDAAMAIREANAGEFLIRSGDASDCLYLLLSGSVEVRLPDESGTHGKRLDVFTAGMNFGEMGFLDGSPRSADVIALDAVVCRVVERALFHRLDSEHPQIKIKLLEQMARHLSANLRRANIEAMTYKG